MRYAVALAVIAAAWAAAVFFHERQVGRTVCVDSCGAPVDEREIATYPVHPSWEDPAATGLVLGSLAAGAGIVSIRRRRHP